MHGELSEGGWGRASVLGGPKGYQSRIYHRPDELERLVNRARARGAVRVSRLRKDGTLGWAEREYLWNVAWDCGSPVWIRHECKGERVPDVAKRWVPFEKGDAQPFDRMRDLVPGRWINPSVLHQVVPCRRCEECLARRRRQWRRRIGNEARWKGRHWFATFTVRPMQRVIYRQRAKARVEESGGSWGGLSQSEALVEITKEAWCDFTKFLKRVRSPRTVTRKSGKRERVAGGKFRYCSVAERHKDGMPHIHALFHEIRPGSVTGRLLKSCWSRHGFVDVELVGSKEQAGSYLTKYLSKEMVGRPHASLRYGAEPWEFLRFMAGCFKKPKAPEPVAHAPARQEGNDCWLVFDADSNAGLARSLVESCLPGEGEVASVDLNNDSAQRDASGSRVRVAECFESERIRYYRVREGSGLPAGLSLALLI